MKKTILLSSFILAALGAAAQIPNAGFESWSNAGGYTEPADWGTLNAMTSAMSVYTAEKGMPGNPGASYLKLTSKTVTGLGVVPGIAATGQLNATTMSVTGGFPFTDRPASLNGAWQYMAMSGSDQGVIAVFLSKWNSSTMKRDTVASAVNPLVGMVMNWANFSIQLTYHKNIAPDSALIVLSSSGMSPANGSYLYVDNLAFTGSVPVGIASTAAVIDHLVSYPNPARSKVDVSFTVKDAGIYSVQLLDLGGKTVGNSTIAAVPGSNHLSLDIASLSPGTYFMNISNGGRSAVRKLVIQ